MQTLSSGRVAAAGGILFTVLTIVGHDILGGGSESPAIYAPRSEIAAYVADHPFTTQVWAGWYLEMLGFVALVWFVGSIWSVLRRAEGEPGMLSTIAFGGGLLAIGLKMVSAVPSVAAHLREGEGFDPQIVAALIDAGNAAFLLSLRCGRPSSRVSRSWW
jgi:hypothetical protein